MQTAHHHRRRRRHHRPVAGADAGPPGPSRAAGRAVGRAVRRCRQRLCRRHAGAVLREGSVCAGRARPGAQVDRAVARDVSGHGRRGHAGGCERARQERGGSLRAADRGPRAHRRRRDRQAGARSRRTIRRRPVLCAGSACRPARGDAVPAGGGQARRRGGRFRHGLARSSGAKDETVIDCRGLGARASAPGPARRARRAADRAHARGRLSPAGALPASAPIRSMSCRGATACTWSAPP